VNWKANVACNFNYLIKAERLFSGSQAVNIYRKTGNILELVRDVATLLLLTTNTTPQPFCGPFSGTIRVSWCQMKASGFYGARE